jgi:serine O-acetyltransferase
MRVFLEDLDVYAFRLGLPGWMSIFMILLYPATWAIGVYRFGNFIIKMRIPGIKHALFVFYFILKRLSEILTGIEIAADAEIGRGLFIGHLGGVIIGTGSKIGRYSSFHEGVTIGGAGRGRDHGSPSIGDFVYFGAGAKVIGRITIGNNVVIGANAVVVKSFPDNVSIAGVPAKIISQNGAEDYIHYRKK